MAVLFQTKTSITQSEKLPCFPDKIHSITHDKTLEFQGLSKVGVS
jgi:hypothetical protein